MNLEQLAVNYNRYIFCRSVYFSDYVKFLKTKDAFQHYLRCGNYIVEIYARKLDTEGCNLENIDYTKDNLLFFNKVKVEYTRYDLLIDDILRFKALPLSCGIWKYDTLDLSHFKFKTEPKYSVNLSYKSKEFFIEFRLVDLNQY